MAARVAPEEREARVLRFPTERRTEGDRAPAPSEERQVVAVILSDGTIRELGERPEEDPRPYATGTVSGDGWHLWWERRRLPKR